MELDNNILMLQKNNTKEDFLNSTLWKTINNGINLGLRYLLPDLMENEIIELKDNLINLGLKDGIKKSIDSVVETGKEALGLITGNFDNIGQVQKIVKNGGLIEKISDVLDIAINKGESMGKINTTTAHAIKMGKNSILTNVEKNIDSTLNNQITNIQNVDKYIENWKEYYNNKNFAGMQKEYNKIQSEIKGLIPIENTLKNARYIETIHNLIKNKGQQFELSKEELELANKLCTYKP